MNKKHIVSLAPTERMQLRQLCDTPGLKKKKRRNAQILLGSDQSENGKHMTDAELSRAYDVTTRTISNVRRDYVEHGLEYTLNGKPPLPGRFPIHYQVTLSESERKELRTLADKPRLSKIKYRNIQILLGVDQGEGGKGMGDEELARAYEVTTRTVRNVRKRCVEHGPEIAVHGKPREPNPDQIKVTGEVEDRLIALSQNVPPAGFASWSLRLLAGQMVELDYIASISHEKVRQVLKKMA